MVRNCHDEQRVFPTRKRQRPRTCRQQPGEPLVHGRPVKAFPLSPRLSSCRAVCAVGFPIRFGGVSFIPPCSYTCRKRHQIVEETPNNPSRLELMVRSCRGRVEALSRPLSFICQANRAAWTTMLRISHEKLRSEMNGQFFDCEIISNCETRDQSRCV